MPYYAVANGYYPGMYRNWSDCQVQVNGYSRADFRKRFCYNDAVRFLTRRGIECEYDCGQLDEYLDTSPYYYYAIAGGQYPGIYNMPWYKFKERARGRGALVRKYNCLMDARYFMKRRCVTKNYREYADGDIDEDNYVDM